MNYFMFILLFSSSQAFAGRIQCEALEARQLIVAMDHSFDLEQPRLPAGMKLQGIPAGSFLMGLLNNKVLVTLTHSFGIMDAPVTQAQWQKIMGANCSKFTDNDQNPANNMTWWSALVYANKVSEDMGLPPTYDMSDMTFKGQAENGTLTPTGGILRINAPNGNIYQAKGFRLMTNAEFEYVMRNLGADDGEYPNGLNAQTIQNYAWTDENSGGKPHPVRTKLPLQVGGQSLYDLAGNVWEWQHDAWTNQSPGGIDPQVLGDAGSYRVIRGGSWNNYSSYCRSADRDGDSADFRGDDVGLRLVRTYP